MLGENDRKRLLQPSVWKLELESRRVEGMIQVPKHRSPLGRRVRSHYCLLRQVVLNLGKKCIAVGVETRERDCRLLLSCRSTYRIVAPRSGSCYHEYCN